jgi:hypothetical protein
MPEASSAPAATTGREPASACEKSNVVDTEQAPSANLQQHDSAQYMNITSLAFEVTARLWELLADASIVGVAQRPASWMASSRTYLYGILEAMSEMTSAFSTAWLHLACNEDTPSASSAQGQAGVQRGLQLSAMMPVIPWSRLRTAATSIAGAGDQDVASLLSSIESVRVRAQAAERKFMSALSQLA